MYHFYYKHETQKCLQDLSDAKPLTVRTVNFKQSIRNNGRSCNATPSYTLLRDAVTFCTLKYVLRTNNSQDKHSLCNRCELMPHVNGNELTNCKTGLVKKANLVQFFLVCLFLFSTCFR